jgi:hypothetical protein
MAPAPVSWAPAAIFRAPAAVLFTNFTRPRRGALSFTCSTDLFTYFYLFIKCHQSLSPMVLSPVLPLSLNYLAAATPPEARGMLFGVTENWTVKFWRHNLLF